MKIPISPRPEEVIITKIKGIWWLTEYIDRCYLVHACKKNIRLLGYPPDRMDKRCPGCKRKTSYDILDRAIVLARMLQ